MNKIIRQIFALVVLLSVGLSTLAASYTVDEVPNVQKKNRMEFVSDPDGFLSDAAKSQINNILSGIRSQTTAEVAFVVIGSMAPEDTDIDSYATELFEHWGIGEKNNDNGVLLVVAVDDRKFSLRTGDGVEGILPDMICRRIITENLVPGMKKGDYDAAMLNTATQLSRVMNDPKYRNELVAETEKKEAEDWDDFINFVLLSALVLTVATALCFVIKLHKLNGRTSYEKYMAMRSWRWILVVLCIFGIGLPLLVFLPYTYLMNKWRNGQHLCPNCHADMNKLDEESDNRYLTPAQDAEERYNSVDYDVWLCPECGETDIYPYVNKMSTLGECPYCHARTAHQLQDRIVVQPTTRSKGQGIREFTCLNCRKRYGIPYDIAKVTSPGVVILPGGFGGGGGGGSIGGGFGGGSTSGGGFSGGW